MAQLDPKWQMAYQAAQSADVIVKNKPGFLHAIIIGKFISGGIIEVSDHVSDGDGNVKIFLETVASDTGFPKTVPVNAEFKVGITADITGSQTHVTFVYR